jgi:hypothetical protein
MVMWWWIEGVHSDQSATLLALVTDWAGGADAGIGVWYYSTLETSPTPFPELERWPENSPNPVERAHASVHVHDRRKQCTNNGVRVSGHMTVHDSA